MRPVTQSMRFFQHDVMKPYETLQKRQSWILDDQWSMMILESVFFFLRVLSYPRSEAVPLETFEPLGSADLGASCSVETRELMCFK